MEPGEASEQTLARELEEELGIAPTQSTYSETILKPSEQLTLHLYLVTAWSGMPVNRPPAEHDEIRWFTPAEATQLPLADPIYPTLFTHEFVSNE